MAELALRHGALIDDRFRLERPLGAGGCGAVWLASDTHGRHEVVLKILHPHFDRYSLAVRQLAREAEVLAQLAHPNIAKPYLFSASGPHTYLVMEHIDGRTLDVEIGAHTRADRYLANREVLSIFEELCSAVSHAHSRTIIHRDLKPQNVMILRRGGGVSVKVLDFGIAKLLEGNKFDATTFGRRLGSMFYMSPEQCRGEPAAVTSDVFSLGVMLFELFTLRRAWAWDVQGRPLRAFEAPVPADGANALSTVLTRVSSAPRPRPSEHRQGLTRAIDDVVVKAMAIEPERRYLGVDALLSELRRAVAGTSRGDFGTEMVTVRNQAPAVAGELAHELETHLALAVVPEPEAGRRGVKVEPTEALPEAKERELAREAKQKERDLLRMNPKEARESAREHAREVKSERGLWRVGGLGAEPSDLAATATMDRVVDPDDAAADRTVPKVPSFAEPPIRISQRFSAKILDEDDSGMTGPTAGVSEPSYEPGSGGGFFEDPASIARARDVSKTGELPRDILTDPRQDGGVLAEPLIHPSYRGRLPAAAPESTEVARPGDDDPAGTMLGALAPADPNQTPLFDGADVDPKVGTGSPGTEVLFAAVPQRLIAEVSHPELTPVRAAELELVGVERSEETGKEPPRPSRQHGTAPLARASAEPRARNLALGPTEALPAAADRSRVEATDSEELVQSIWDGVRSHKLAVIGGIGMLIAFAAGLAIARWAAVEVRLDPPPVEIAPKGPATR